MKRTIRRKERQDKQLREKEVNFQLNDIVSRMNTKTIVRYTLEIDGRQVSRASTLNTIKNDISLLLYSMKVKVTEAIKNMVVSLLEYLNQMETYYI